MSLICYNQFKIVINLTLIKLVLSDHLGSVTFVCIRNRHRVTAQVCLLKNKTEHTKFLISIEDLLTAFEFIDSI